MNFSKLSSSWEIIPGGMKKTSKQGESNSVDGLQLGFTIFEIESFL